MTRLTSNDFSYWRFYSVMKYGYEGRLADYYESPAYKSAWEFGHTRRDKPFPEVEREWEIEHQKKLAGKRKPATS
jgi:hypothetical protein